MRGPHVDMGCGSGMARAGAVPQMARAVGYETEGGNDETVTGARVAVVCLAFAQTGHPLGSGTAIRSRHVWRTQGRVGS